MKRTIINVKANKKDEFWCSLHGNALEIIGANLSILKHTVEILKGEGERGKNFYRCFMKILKKCSKKTELE